VLFLSISSCLNKFGFINSLYITNCSVELIESTQKHGHLNRNVIISCYNDVRAIMRNSSDNMLFQVIVIGCYYTLTDKSDMNMKQKACRNALYPWLRPTFSPQILSQFQDNIPRDNLRFFFIISDNT
jgi:hypothetical protein